jgi:hypothetical protein
MMKNSDRIDDVERVRPKWQTEHVRLNQVHPFASSHIGIRGIDGIGEIYADDFGSQAVRHFQESSGPHPDVEDELAVELLAG